LVSSGLDLKAAATMRVLKGLQTPPSNSVGTTTGGQP
jgi:hypothetical protein